MMLFIIIIYYDFSYMIVHQQNRGFLRLRSAQRAVQQAHHPVQRQLRHFFSRTTLAVSRTKSARPYTVVGSSSNGSRDLPPGHCSMAGALPHPRPTRHGGFLPRTAAVPDMPTTP